MNEEAELQTNQHWLRGYKDYWTGIGVITVIYCLILAVFDSEGTGLLFKLVLSIIFVPIFFSIISGIIFIIAWLFKRNFKFQRFLNILTTVAFLSLLFKIIALFR